jgi:hypothetical protein
MSMEFDSSGGNHVPGLQAHADHQNGWTRVAGGISEPLLRLVNIRRCIQSPRLLAFGV